MGDPEHSDPLTQPTRARVYARLEVLRRPARVEEIAKSLSLHPNSVRLHLERLAEDGLVRRARVAGATGRPHYEWSIDPAGRPAGRDPRAYPDLARWLARAIAEKATSERALERTGRAIGREIAPPAGDRETADVLEATFASMGFAPRRERSANGLAFSFGNCPYRDVAEQDPGVVCTIHRGLTQGLLEVTAPGTRLSEFVPGDPAVAGCLVRVEG